jgi:hypothetical protein
MSSNTGRRLSASVEPVQRASDPSDILRRHVGVLERCLDVLVPKKLLDVEEVRPVLEERGGEAVT